MKIKPIIATSFLLIFPLGCNDYFSLSRDLNTLSTYSSSENLPRVSLDSFVGYTGIVNITLGFDTIPTSEFINNFLQFIKKPEFKLKIFSEQVNPRSINLSFYPPLSASDLQEVLARANVYFGPVEVAKRELVRNQKESDERKRIAELKKIFLKPFIRP